MILRNVVTRHSQKTISAPLQRCCFRFLTTDVLTPQVEAMDDTIQTLETDGASTASDLGELHLTQKIIKPKRNYKKPAHPLKVQHRLNKHYQATTSKIGAIVEPFYQPEQAIIDPPKPDDITLELLMANQAHLGHSTSLWNPMNQRYIYGVRQGIHIISLEITAQHLRRAAKVVESVTYHGGLVLFVGTRKGQKDAVVRAAELAKGYHVFDRWRPGAITNNNQLLGQCELRVVGLNDEDLEGYNEKLAMAPALRPDLVVIMNPLENNILLHECEMYHIPTIGIIDTNADPTRVTYPIPANDDSIRCVEVIAGVLGRAGEAGQERRLEDAKLGISTWLPTEGLGLPYDGDEQKKREAEAERDVRESDFVEPIRQPAGRRDGKGARRDDGGDGFEDEGDY